MISNVAEAPGRSCGACQACCVTMKIEAVESPAGEPCRHLCRAGCGIYDERPDTCRAFLCRWLAGWGRKFEHRPDRFGAVPGMSGDGSRPAYWLLGRYTIDRLPKRIARQIEHDLTKYDAVLVLDGEGYKRTTVFNRDGTRESYPTEWRDTGGQRYNMSSTHTRTRSSDDGRRRQNPRA